MQAVLNNFYQDIEQLISNLSSSNKNEVENKIVKMGESAVDFLVDKLPSLKGIERGVVAMSIIRIGEAAIAPLKRQASAKNEFGWIANYLISEIKS